MGSNFLGEFEQRVLLAILRSDSKAYRLRFARKSRAPLDMSRLAARSTPRSIGSKPSNWCAGLLKAAKPDEMDCRSANFRSRRRVAALRASRRALLELWRGLEETLES